MKNLQTLILFTVTSFFSLSGTSQTDSVTAVKSATPKKNPLNTLYAKGLNYIMKDSSFSVKVGFRFQTLMQLESTSDNTEYIEGKAMVRRSRLKFDGFVYSPDIVYKAELALSNSDIGNPVKEGSNASNIVLDAVVKYKFAKHASLWFGQTKLPGNRERVISSQALQFVDRSNLNSEYNIDRDLGFQLHHEFKIGKIVLRDIYSVSMGEGRNITSTNIGGLDYTGRLEVLPLGKFTSNGDYVSSDIYREPKPKLSIGVTYDYNDDAGKEKGQLGKFLTKTCDLQTIFADLMFKYRGFSIMAEYADKQGDRPVIMDDKGVQTGKFIIGKGLNVQGGYLFKNNWEVAGRYTEVYPKKSTGLKSSWMYTLGISRYVVGHNLKFQTDVSLLDEEFTTSHELMFRFQTEIAF